MAALTRLPASQLKVGDVLTGDYDTTWDYQLTVTKIEPNTRNSKEFFIHTERFPKTGKFLKDNRCLLVYGRKWFTVQPK